MSNGYFDNNRNTVPAIKNIEESIIKRINNCGESGPPQQCDCASCHGKKNMNGGVGSEYIRHELAELRKKNDMMCMFIVFLVVMMVIQYNTLNQRVYYASPGPVVNLSAPAVVASS
jgi:hypothetical protein